MRMTTRVCALTVLACAIGVEASAQSSDRPRRWQVEVVGGVSVFDLPTSGEALLPAPGPSLPTTSPTNPSRRVPTWFLADGASLLNGANTEFGVAAQLAPLDPVLGRLGLTGSNAPVGGLRLSRYLSDRIALEVGADLHQGAASIDADILAAAEVARAGFVSAFTGLFSTGPFSNVTVNATSTVTGSNTREVVLSGAVRFHILSGNFSPFVTLGGGAITDLGERPQVQLKGDYAFTWLGTSRFEESDTLTVRFDQQTSVLGVGGLGFVSRISDRVGLVVDGRVLVGKPTYVLRLDSSPTVTTLTPADVIESGTTPAVQFSNNTATGRLSTLSGTPLSGFEAFRTSSVQLRYVVTAGIALRF